MVDDKSELSDAATTESVPADSPVDTSAPATEAGGEERVEDSSPESRGGSQDDSADNQADRPDADEPGDNGSRSQGPVAEDPSDEQEPGAEDDSPAAQPLELIEESADADGDEQKDWYILKVQVNREKSICDALRRRVKVAGLDNYFGEILIPTEDVREFNKSGKQRIVKRKLYPGYILVNMAINDDTWFLVRETPGIGDFTGAAGKPTPMEKHEVDRILKSMRPADDESGSPEKTNIRFKQGDRVRVKEGYFQNFEGEVESIDEANGRITVMINIFGRPTPVELDHWQFEDV